MIEFGEKLKQVREEKGMTQQTLADQLYVTRQAVSRWECGARYPDLLTTKKIAAILEVSIDELVSGEELKRDVEREQILRTPVSGTVQTMLYAIAFCGYLILGIYILVSLFPGMEESREGRMVTLAVAPGYWGSAVVFCLGLLFSLRGIMTPKRTGILMSVSYFLMLYPYFVSYLFSWNKSSLGLGTLMVCLTECVGMVLIYSFFADGRKMSVCWIYLVSGIDLLRIALECLMLPSALKPMINGYTISVQLMLVVRLVHFMGRIGLALLLICQAYVLDKKRRESQI
ncbi:MAG: helix-turn-helix transcriptional regulator [Eubacteriales bacterium]|nr:helix-turn-helix transcriptional regulator [Eubacteriales bacterium]